MLPRQIWKTLEGTLAIDLGKFDGAETLQAVTSGRNKSSDTFDVAKGSSAAGGAKPSAKSGAGAGGKLGKGGSSSKKIDPREAARLQQLEQEAEVRAGMRVAKAKLSKFLAVIVSVCEASPDYAKESIDQMGSFATPLLNSPLVGETAAFPAVVSLARCLPHPLGSHPCDVAAALCLTSSAEPQDGEADPALSSPIVLSVIGSMQSTCQGLVARQLPEPCYRFVFPVLSRILMSATVSEAHEPALGLLSQHVCPGCLWPYQQTVECVLQLSQTMPSQKARLQNVLSEVCEGIPESNIPTLLNGLLSDSAETRLITLGALPAIPELATGALPLVPAIAVPLWVVLHDNDEGVSGAAEGVWDTYGHDFPGDFIPDVVKYLSHEHEVTRQSAACAIVEALEDSPGHLRPTVEGLCSLFPSASTRTQWGIMAAVREMVGLLGPQVQQILDFTIRKGLVCDDEGVRSIVLEAGCALLNAHGQSCSENVLPVLESYLSGSAQSVALENEHQYDLVREGVIVLYGTLASHLPKGDARVTSIIEKLISALPTPSESVQRSVSKCLGQLMGNMSKEQENVEEVLRRVMTLLLEGESYAERRGGAYGLAGCVKGLGMSSLKSLGIMDRLKAAIDDKKDPRCREGALFAFEALCETLGRLFEPYIVQILPMLLTAYGDTLVEVRRAARAAGKRIMGMLSAHGVKLVLPALLGGTQEKAWRTKQASCLMLGAMSNCAPRQLSTALPNIVPKLSEVLGDTHPKVQAAAQKSLEQIGKVVRNPEVSQLAPVLLAAISRPAEKTKTTLEALLSTRFVNSIDAPALALILPVVIRGLRDRSADGKKKAAKIVGSMCHLVTNPKDMVPYVPDIVPEIKQALVDPAPDVRIAAAKAAAALMSGLGSENLSDLVPWLLETMRSDGSAVERQGAAQGLAEVLAVQGHEELNALMPDLLAGCADGRAAAREGHLTLLRYLPVSFGEAGFGRHIAAALPRVLGGLADESEGVRSAALAAGRIFIAEFTDNAVSTLLPSIIRGMEDLSWRIRMASVELLGSLLYKLSGVTGNIQTTGDDDEGGTCSSQTQAVLLEALGQERRDRALAELAIAKADLHYEVRSASMHVWKSVVPNSPKAISEIIGEVMRLVIARLGGGGAEEDELQLAAGSCLGDLVKKMGDRVLPKVLEALRSGAIGEEATVATRRGTCRGAGEVLANCNRNLMSTVLPELLPVVQQGLCDSDPATREASGRAIAALFRGPGAVAVEETVIPSTLDVLEAKTKGPDMEDKQNRALEGLRVVLAVRPQLLQAVLPRLCHVPLTAMRAKALGAMAEAVSEGGASPALVRVLARVLRALLPEAGAPEESPAREAASEALRSVAQAVGATEGGSGGDGNPEGSPEEGSPEDSPGAEALMAELRLALEKVGPKMVAAADLVRVLAEAQSAIVVAQADVLVKALFPPLAVQGEGAADAWRACHGALVALEKALPRESLPQLVQPCRTAVSDAVERTRRHLRQQGGAAVMAAEEAGGATVAGLAEIPRPLGPLLPIYIEGLRNGATTEMRESAADGLGDLVEASPAPALRPHVAGVAGPLIRLAGDRFPWEIKAAILRTLGSLLKRSGPALRPFAPQLQTTFLKCLQDPASEVRDPAAENLGALSAFAMRVDQLASDLSKLVVVHGGDPDSDGSGGVGASALKALGGVLRFAGARLKPDVLSAAGDALQAAYSASGEAARRAAAVALGAHLALAGPDALEAQLLPLLEKHGEEAPLALLRSFLGAGGAEVLREAGLTAQVQRALARACQEGRPAAVKTAAAAAAGELLRQEGAAEGGAASPPSLGKTVPPITALLAPAEAQEVQAAGLLALRMACYGNPRALVPGLQGVLPSLCALGAAAQRDGRMALKADTDRTLAVCLALGLDGAEPAAEVVAQCGPEVRQALSDAALLRLSKLPLDLSELKAQDLASA